MALEATTGLMLTSMPPAKLSTGIQQRFAAHSPAGWRCRSEAPLADADGRSRFGFKPREDRRLKSAFSGWHGGVAGDLPLRGELRRPVPPMADRRAGHQ
jgi:hypothetical protein